MLLQQIVGSIGTRHLSVQALPQMVMVPLMGSLPGLWAWMPSSSWPCCACRGNVNNNAKVVKLPSDGLGAKQAMAPSS